MTHAKRHPQRHRARQHGHWPNGNHNHNRNQHIPPCATDFQIEHAAHPTKPTSASIPTPHQQPPPFVNSNPLSPTLPAYSPQIPTPPIPHPPHTPLSARDLPKPGSTSFTLAIAIVLAAFTSLLAAVIYCSIKWIRRRREKKTAAARSKNGVYWGNVDYHMQRDWGIGHR